jgi:glyoxylase-like metal-dependent hydrolase (beta-lactamase superfamily II)
VTQTIELLTDYIPKPGECYEISPGILWIRMPLPFRLNHINLWLIEEVDGWVLIDSGINDDSTKACWEQIFNNVLKGKPITRLVGWSRLAI